MHVHIYFDRPGAFDEVGTTASKITGRCSWKKRQIRKMVHFNSPRVASETQRPFCMCQSKPIASAEQMQMQIQST